MLRGRLVITYSTLMVHLQLGQSNAGLLKIAGDLADRLRAAVVGVAACQTVPDYGETGYGYTSGEVIVAERTEIQTEAAAAEAEFRGALQARARLVEWRSAVVSGSLAEHLARQARCGDLILTGVSPTAFLDRSRHSDIAGLVMRAGRPVLIAPPAADGLRLERIVVCWKDTREARRAALDAMPLLECAKDVAVVEVVAERELAGARDRLEDVVAWLKGHGVAATPVAAPSGGAEAAHLNEIIQRRNADLIVAGAYGHNRLEEWVLGGVTRDLLLRADRCSLVSH